jgi:HrpA-like RNA helicase
VLLPLHAGLPLEAQEKVFDAPPQGARKVRRAAWRLR